MKVYTISRSSDNIHWGVISVALTYDAAFAWIRTRCRKNAKLYIAKSEVLPTSSSWYIIVGEAGNTVYAISEYAVIE